MSTNNDTPERQSFVRDFRAWPDVALRRIMRHSTVKHLRKLAYGVLVNRRNGGKRV